MWGEDIAQRQMSDIQRRALLHVLLDGLLREHVQVGDHLLGLVLGQGVAPPLSSRV